MSFIITKKTYTEHNDFYVETQMGENHIMLFLYHVKITFIGSTNFQYSPTPTGRRHQPPDLQAPT
jgi:hypothetical protein